MSPRTVNKDDLELVKEMLDHGDFDEIREMVRVWRGLKAIGYLGSVALKICALVGGLYGAWYAFSEWLLIFLRGNVS